MAHSRGTNPFLTEEEYDDDAWSSRKYNDFGGGNSSYGDKESQIQASKERTLDSSRRALASIYESERMGIETGEELVRQKEQLDNVERNLDKINTDMNTTQKHLNSIKSVFGGIKSWFIKDTPKEERPKESQPSKLHDALDNTEHRPREEHPRLKMQAQDEAQTFGGSSKAYDAELDEHLDLMSDGMSRLKGLAVGLGDEISTHNVQLDRIDQKASKGLYKIQDQNTQMRKIQRN